MSKSTLSLTKEDIDEELVNNDLLNSGGVDNEVILNDMNLEEKKELLRGINQSKEEFHSESSSSPKTHSELDISITNFPSLPVTGKNNTANKLRLQRKTTNVSLRANFSQDKSEKSISLDDDNDVKVIPVKFNLPFCIDDGELPLPLPEILKPKKPLRTPYYVMEGENPSVALRRMLADHDRWMAAYTAETSRIESHALGKDIEDSDSEKQRHSPKNTGEEDEENDPYVFVSKSPIHVSKVYSGQRKREPSNSSKETVGLNNPKPWTQGQRRTSRDSDSEDVEEILKPAEIKPEGWISVGRQRSKRNRKQTNNQDKGRPKSVEENTEVEFGFTEKWEGQSAEWRSPHSPSMSSLNNQISSRRPLSSTSVVEEETVQCPICQKRFPQSKVENHAATCEGYSVSPMEVEDN